MKRLIVVLSVLVVMALASAGSANASDRHHGQAGYFQSYGGSHGSAYRGYGFNSGYGYDGYGHGGYGGYRHGGHGAGLQITAPHFSRRLGH